MATDLTEPDAPPRPPAEALPGTARARRRRHPVAWTIALIGFVLIFAVLWIGVRGFLAQQQLTAAIPAAERVKAAIGAGDLSGAVRATDELRRKASDAASLTSDPIWRAAEVVPWVGPNLAAVRTAASASDTVASRVLKPLLAAGPSVDPRTIALGKGQIDLAPIRAAQPAAAHAQSAYAAALADVARIDTRALVAPVGNGIVRLRALLERGAPAVDAAANAVRLLPGMLGADGPRDYLLAAQNPAELRSTGGLIGALALVHTDNGAITLMRQEPGTAIGPWESDVSPIPLSTQGIFGPLVGRYLQDANLTPDFPLAASTVARMWTTANGGRIDGVIAVDPVVLNGLLTATGPVRLPSGDELTSSNAVQLLLSDVYRRYAEPAQQDEFFTDAAAAVFHKLSSGGTDSGKLLKALVAAGDSRRLLIWSAHAGDQKILGGTTLAGGLPVSSPSTAGIGVYFNDATGSKMDYYLGSAVSAGAAVCRADGKPSTVVGVTLTNRAPADAATSLPRYVTGGEGSGTPPGHIRTRVAVYGPADGLLAATLSDGAAYPTVAGVDGTRPVSVFTVELAPGESKTVSVQFLNVAQTAPKLDVVTTPTLPGSGSTPNLGVENAATPIAVQCSSIVK